MYLDWFSLWSRLDIPALLQKWTEVLRGHFWGSVYADYSFGVNDRTTPLPEITAAYRVSDVAPKSAFQSKLLQENTRVCACLPRSCGFTARRALEVNTNYRSFTPWDLTCFGLPIWHVGFWEHPALQWILLVQCPALQLIPLPGVVSSGETWLLVLQKNKRAIKKIKPDNQTPKKSVNKGWKKITCRATEGCRWCALSLGSIQAVVWHS